MGPLIEVCGVGYLTKSPNASPTTYTVSSKTSYPEEPEKGAHAKSTSYIIDLLNICKQRNQDIRILDLS